MGLLSSGVGQYFVQTVLHATIIALVVEAVINTYHLTKFSYQIRLRFLVLLLPVLYLPFFFLLYPMRSSEHFRRHLALFDSNQWLMLRLWDDILLGHLFLAVLVGTALFFFFKEMVPFLKFYLGHHPSPHILVSGQFPRVEEVITRLTQDKGLPRPVVLVSAENAPTVYTSGLKTLVLSTSAVNMLDNDELEAIIAHELAHFTGGVSGINRAGLALRFMMFYNPIALLIFRRMVSDLERHCDDIAVTVTGKPLALASGLLKAFRCSPMKCTLTPNDYELSRTSTLEDKACRELVKERVNRILSPEEADDIPYYKLRLMVVAGFLTALLFFVV